VPSPPAGEGSGGPSEDAGEDAMPPAGGARTTEERREELDRELDESLSELDRALLREKETLAEQRPEGASGSREGVAGGTDGGGEGAEESAAGTDAAAGSSSAADGNVGGASAPGGKPSGDAEHDPRVPADVRDGSGDDVVARQLREAAMSEDDPELREKLWDEYRRYESGRQREKKQEDGDEDADD
jgi:hypothetical protein